MPLKNPRPDDVRDPVILDILNKQHRSLIKIMNELTEEASSKYDVNLMSWTLMGNEVKFVEKILKILTKEKLKILLYLFTNTVEGRPVWTRLICREVGHSREDISKNLNELVKLGLVFRVRGETGYWKRCVFNFLTRKGIYLVRDLLLLLGEYIE